MPELPETETIARGLEARLRDATIAQVEVPRPDVLRGATSAEFTTRLANIRLRRCWRRAKSIIIELASDDRLVVTPRFTGGLFLAPPEVSPDDAIPEGYTAVVFRLRDRRTLRYRDVRRLGTVALMDTKAFSAWDAALGPEPLDPRLTAEHLSVFIRSSTRAIKTVLMDQRRLAGVGNIYANEALWAAGISPARSAARLTRPEIERLLAELRRLLSASIAAGGTSFRDYRDADGARGQFAEQLLVYGRAGDPCARCGTTLRSHHRLEGRATVWCATCQR